jgi:DNA-3-methyladenine glycosylase I
LIETPSSYCQYVRSLPEEDLHRKYHDHEYGFPLSSDNELFGRLLLEINQAGLSWTTILKKKDHFRRAYSDFEIAKVAVYTVADRERLLSDPGIVRNKLKVNAAIYNAQQILLLQRSCGSFKAWLEEHKGIELTAWVKLFKKQFKFTGGEITKEFLLSTGYLVGAHDEDCPIYKKLNA